MSRMVGRPGGGSMGEADKAKDFAKTLKKLGKYLKRYYVFFIIAVFLCIGASVFSIIGPKILGNATTLIFDGLTSKVSGGAGIDFTKLGNILLLLLGLYSASALFTFIQGLLMNEVAFRASFNLREDISKKMNTLPLSYYDKHTIGDTLSRVTNDVDLISDSLNQVIQSILTNVITVIGIIIMMFTISWQLTIIALLVLPASFLVISLVVKKSQRYFKLQQDTLGVLNGHVEEMYAGHNIVSVFNQEQRSIKTFEEENGELYTSAWKSQFLSTLMMPMMNMMTNIGLVGVIVFGAYIANKKIITVGDIQAFIQYMRSFNQPVSQFAQITNVLQSAVAAAERVFTFLETPDEKAILNPQEPEITHGSVEFKNVHFGYTDDKIIIPDFSATLEPGTKIAIVGPTGAGKTTLVKLLMHFYDIQGGDILVDGQSIYAMERQSLRQNFGMVLQDTWLFSGSIKDNLLFGNLEATQDEIVKAAKLARADTFIRTLPEGYDTILNEETTNISQGQKQLLTIARAILRDPKILILDEATSSVDTRTEKLIQQAMENLMVGRTSFVIAHRLSTIKDADTILVLDQGDIVEVGNHDELLAKNGFYAKLYYAQFAGTDI